MWQQLFVALAVVNVVSAQADTAGNSGAKKCNYSLSLMGNVETEEVEKQLIDPLGLKLASQISAATLAGVLEILVDLVEGSEIVVKIFKILDNSVQYVTQVDGQICENIPGNGTIWWPIVQAMNLTSCPVKARTYEILQVTVSLGPFDEFMCAPYVGTYRLTLTVLQDGKEIVIVALTFGIFEDTCEE